MSAPNRPPRISTKNQRALSNPHSPSLTRPLSARPSTSDMSSRKRPAEPRSRGNSPPDKRSRDRYAANTNPVSPPPSRTGSIVGLPDNVPTGPALRNKDGLKIDRYRSGPNADGVERRAPNGISRLAEDTSRRGSAGNIMSPRSIESGGSTPVHAAPPAPSMRPKNPNGGSSHINQQDPGAGAGTPVALDALQNLKLRRQAMAKEAKARQVAQQIDATQLKKERDQLASTVKSMSLRLDELEKSSQDQNQPKGAELLKRIVELEKSSTSDSNGQLHLESVSGLQREIDSLKTWKETQAITKSHSELEENNKALIFQEILKKTGDSKKVLQKELKDTELRLTKRMDDDRDTIRTLSIGFSALDAFKKDLDTRNYPGQLKSLADKVNEIKNNESKTYGKAKSAADTANDAAQDIEDVRKDIEDFIGQIGKEREWTGKTLVQRIKNFASVVGQVSSLQSEQMKFSKEQKKLIERHSALSETQDALSTRLDSLELKNQGPGPAFKKVGTTTKPSTNTDAIGQQLSRHENEIKELRAASAGFQGVSAQVTQLDERSKSFDKQLSKVKALELSDNVVQEKLGRLTTELKALHVQLAAVEQLQTSLPNRDMGAGNAAVQTSTNDASFDASSIVQIRDDIEELFRILNDIGKKVHDQATTAQSQLDDVASIVQQQLDGQNSKVKKDLANFSNGIDECRADLLKLKEQRPDLQTQSPSVVGSDVQQAQLQSLVEDAKTLKEDIVSLNTRLQHEASVRGQEVEDVKQTVSLKVDATASEQQLAHLRHSFRNLQDQYNNITTDDLHQRMVHWFLQNYPHSTAAALQQIAGMQVHITSLQQSLHSLNSENTPFVKVQTLRDIQTQLTTRIGELVSTERQERIDAMNELRTSAGNDHELRVKEKAQTKIILDSLGAQITRLQNDVSSVQDATGRVRDQVTAINEHVIEPNREYFALFGDILIKLAELEKAAENLGQNLPRGGKLNFDWTTTMATLQLARSEKSDKPNGVS